MIEALVGNAGQRIQTNAWLAIVAVFAGGVLTASNPCVLAAILLARRSTRRTCLTLKRESHRDSVWRRRTIYVDSAGNVSLHRQST